MRSHRTFFCAAAAAVAVLAGCKDKNPENLPDSAPSSAAPAPAAPDPYAGRKSKVDLDVSLGGAPEHVILTGGEELGKLDPKDIFVRFTFSQSNEQPAGHPARWTVSLQAHDLPIPGQSFGAQGHLRYKGVTYANTTAPCTVTVTNQSPAQGPNHARWLEGTFVCEQMSAGSAPDAAAATARITNGRFEGPFVDSGPK